MLAEKAEDEKAAPPAPVGFFDASLSQVRKQVFVQWIRTGTVPHLTQIRSRGTRKNLTI